MCDAANGEAGDGSSIRAEDLMDIGIAACIASR